MISQNRMVKNMDFGAEVARILPRILIEFSRRQKNFFMRTSLNISQVIVLEVLSEHSHCKMNELAKILNLTMSAVTAIIDKMIRHKLVKRERSSEDRRVVNVTMVSKGRQLIKQVREIRCSCANELFASLTEQDKQEYLRILKKAHLGLRKRRV